MRSTRFPNSGRSFFRRVRNSGSLAVGCGIALLVLLATCTITQPARAVSVYNDVLLYTVDSDTGDTEYFADNPLTSANEGIPTDGNYVEQGVDLGDQITFEGLPDDNGTPFDFTDDTNKNFNIVVGRTGNGTLTIDGGDQLRDMHLVIGDSGSVMVGGNEVLRRGTGTVIISSSGALYNNDPYISPWFPAPWDPADPVAVPVSVEPRDPEVGYDLFVGRTGTGTLQITQGAGAEIQDAVIVGDFSTGAGDLTVNGVGSYLISGGFDTSGTTSSSSDDYIAEDEGVHYFAIGRRGTGTVNVTEGGQIYTRCARDGNEAIDPPVAAVIGGNAYVVDSTASGTNPPAADSGSGTVTVDGDGSTWTMAGNLQVGTFHLIQTATNRDDEGDNVDYSNGVGTAVLNVTDGGLVVITPPEQSPATSNNVDSVMMLIGYGGTVNMLDGQIVMQAGSDSQDPTNPLAQGVEILNDGLIQGSGTIETGAFSNRYYGKVHVSAGESLEIIANSANTVPTEPSSLMNYGLIEVIGTEDARAELDVSRLLAEGTDPALPFVNRPVATTTINAPTTFDGGLITAQWATLRFASGYIDPNTGAIAPAGMRNEGIMAFTAGTNIIEGFVLNAQDPNFDPANPPLNPLFTIGANTTVVVEDDFAVAPPAVLTMGAGAHLNILDQRTLWLAGETNLTLSTASDGPISASGDVIVGGDLVVSLSNDLLYSLVHGSMFEVLSFTGTAYGADTSCSNCYVAVGDALLTGGQGFESLTTNADLLYPNLDSLVQMLGNAFYLTFLDPSMVGVGVVGADFDGSGIVDAADLAIWRANFGITDGASVLQGDADGDGDVDGVDFLLLQQQYGGPPVPAAGAGALLGLSTTVPEPASGLLLAVGAMLALAAVRRRR